MKRKVLCTHQPTGRRKGLGPCSQISQLVGDKFPSDSYRPFTSDFSGCDLPPHSTRYSLPLCYMTPLLCYAPSEN